MALTLPSLFHGAAGNTYAASRVRRLAQSLACDQEGVLSGDHLVVIPDSPASLRVRVGSGRAWIANDVSAAFGAYLVENVGPTVTPFATAAHATLGRIDLVVLRVRDIANDGTSGEVTDTDAFEIVAGTPAASPVAPAIPNNSIPLAEILIPAASAVVTTITDRRPIASFIAPNANLLGNARFDYWSRGTTTAPDAWNISGGTIGQDTVNVEAGRVAAALTNTVSTQMTLLQRIGGTVAGLDGLMVALRGRQVTLVARVRASVAARVGLTINDGSTGSSGGAQHSGSGLYETLTVTGTIGVAAIGPISVGVLISSGSVVVAQVASVGLFLGSVGNPGSLISLSAGLRSQADDDVHTMRVYEHGTINVANYGTAGGTIVNTLQFRGRKAATPTVTFSGASYANASGGGLSVASVDSLAYQYVATALGMATMTITWDAVV